MNIVVVGLGSMGKRRIRLIRELYPNYNIIGIDAREDRRHESSEKYNIICYKTTDDVKEKMDCVFVCTSPLSHNEIIKNAINRNCHVFTELNLVYEGYSDNIKLAIKKNVKLFLSSTFLYREEIKFLRNEICDNHKWNYIYHIGQYLPDWHPWENYNDFFLADRRTNGCREIMAIELPWIVKTFGDVKNIQTISDKLTNLDIDYHDNYMLQIVHKNGNKGCLIVDVVSPCAVRKLEVYSENKYYSWNGTPDTLFYYNTEEKELTKVILKEKNEHMEGYSSFIVEDAYKNEIKTFFEYILDKKTPEYSFEQDYEILKLIETTGA